MSKRRRLAVALVVALLLGAGVYAGWRAVWRAVMSDPNYRAYGYVVSFDVRGGLQRKDEYFMYVRYRGRVTQTKLSRTYAEVVGPLPEPSWRKVRSFKRAGLRAHTVGPYDAAIMYADRLADLLSGDPFGDQAKHKAVLTFLQVLEEDGDYIRAEEYVLRLEEWIVSRYPGKGDEEPIGPDDLPPPPQPYAQGSDAGPNQEPDAEQYVVFRTPAAVRQRRLGSERRGRAGCGAVNEPSEGQLPR